MNELLILLLLLIILGAVGGTYLFTTWEILRSRREAAYSAIAAARAAIATEQGLHLDLKRASRDFASHERGMHTQINRDWSKSAKMQSGGFRISHLGQSFPTVASAGIYSTLAEKISQGTDHTQRVIAAANSCIESYNTLLRTFPGCLFRSFKPLDYFVPHHTHGHHQTQKRSRGRHKSRSARSSKSPRTWRRRRSL